MKNFRLLTTCLVLGITSAPASAGFIIDGNPVSSSARSSSGFNTSDVAAGYTWTQRIMVMGNFDYIAFEIVTDNGGGPFEAPALSNFTNPADGDAPAADWNAVFDDANMIHATGPASTVALSFDIHLDGSISEPVTFQGVAFLNGVFQFSADFVWTGAGTVSITNEDVWNPDPASLPGLMVPLPAAIWLAGIGLLGIVIGRKRLRRLAMG